MKSIKCRKALLVSSAVLAAVLSAQGVAFAQSQPTYQFDIPAESLSKALKDFSVASSQQLVFSERDVTNRSAPVLHGSYTRDQALAILLAGTDLRVETSASGVIMVRSKNVQAASNEAAQPSTIETVVVTGTSIAGVHDITSPLNQLNRAEIDRSGSLTLQDYLQTVPQLSFTGTYGAGPDGMLGSGSLAPQNGEHATAANLRGLGENSTLVLLNGHRMAPSDNGNVVDISTIPLAAIDHIDIVTDGASAIYGADAVAGVVNFVLRQGYDGAQTSAAYGTVTNGGLQNTQVGQLFGKAWDTGSLMLDYEYSHETALPTSERSFTAAVPQPTNIINPYTEHALIANGEQRIGSQFTIFGDAMLTWKQSTTLDAVSGTPYDYKDNASAINFHLCARYEFSDTWALELDGTYAKQETDFQQENAAEFPTEPVGVPIAFFTAHTPEFDAKVTGVPFSLPGGDVKLAFGATMLVEDATEHYTDPYVIANGNQKFARNDMAEYAELYIPFVSEENSLPLIKKLTVSAAIRHDGYTDNLGSTTNPKFGVIWSPFDDLNVRANWSTAFRPPSIGEVFSNTYEGSFASLIGFTNPSGPGYVGVINIFGYNPNLKPETAKTYDVGFDYQPSVIPGLKFTFDYYSVDYRNRLELPPFNLNALLQQNIYGSLIGHYADDAAAAGAIAALAAQGYTIIDAKFLFGLPPGATGIRYSYHYQLTNAAIVQQDGFDLTGTYNFQIGTDDIQTDISLAYINKIETQFAPGATAFNEVNTFGQPLRLKVRWDGTWTHGPLEVTTAVNFSNGYGDPYSNPVTSIASFTTFDVSAALKLDGLVGAGLLDGTTFRVSATNLFDKSPPYAPGPFSFSPVGANYDAGNASPIGRFISVQLQHKW